MSGFKESKWSCISLGSRSLALLLLSHIFAGCTWAVDIYSLGILNEPKAPGMLDRSSPSIVLYSTEKTTTKNTKIPVSVVVSESLKSLSSEDFDVTNAVISQVNKTDAGYSFILTPNMEGLVSVSLPAKIVQDLAGNRNTASNTLSFKYSSSISEAVLSSSADNSHSSEKF